jgi:hypothetical protein
VDTSVSRGQHHTDISDPISAMASFNPGRGFAARHVLGFADYESVTTRAFAAEALQLEGLRVDHAPSKLHSLRTQRRLEVARSN